MKEKGATTLLEMLVVLSIMGVLAMFILINVNAVENARRTRDLNRITDLSVLMQAIEEYRIDHDNQLPGELDQAYRSDRRNGTPCAPNCANISQGWLDFYLGGYMATLRTDPNNTDPFVYRYKHDGVRYELSCVLEAEHHQDMMSNDGGNNNGLYELGTGIETISF